MINEYIVESQGRFLLVKTFQINNTVVSKIIKEIDESLVPVNAVGQEQISGLTGDPPVYLKKRKRSKLMKRNQNA